MKKNTKYKRDRLRRRKRNEIAGEEAGSEMKSLGAGRGWGQGGVRSEIAIYTYFEVQIMPEM